MIGRPCIQHGSSDILTRADVLLVKNQLFDIKLLLVSFRASMVVIANSYAKYLLVVTTATASKANNCFDDCINSTRMGSTSSSLMAFLGRTLRAGVFLPDAGAGVVGADCNTVTYRCQSVIHRVHHTQVSVTEPAIQSLTHELHQRPHSKLQSVHVHVCPVHTGISHNDACPVQ